MLAELAQLLLRLVRPGRARLGRQAAARALAPGGEREDLRLLGLVDPAARGARRGRRRRGCSTCSSRATSAASPGSSPRSRSPCRRCPSRSTATTTPTRCSRCCSSRPPTSARARSSRGGCGRCSSTAAARRARLQHEDARGDGRRARPRARVPAVRPRARGRGGSSTSPLAGVVLVVVSGAWIAAVDLTPGGQPALRRHDERQQRLQPRVRLQRARPRDRPDRRDLVRRRRRARRRVLRDARLLCACSTTRSATRAAWLLPLALVGGLSALVAALAPAAPARARRADGRSAAGSSPRRSSSASRAGSSTRTTSRRSRPATCALVGIGVVSLWRDARRRMARWLALPLLALGLARLARGRPAAPLRLPAVAADARDRGLRGRGASRSSSREAAAALPGRRLAAGRASGVAVARAARRAGRLVGDDARRRR